MFKYLTLLTFLIFLIYTIYIFVKKQKIKNILISYSFIITFFIIFGCYAIGEYFYNFAANPKTDKSKIFSQDNFQKNKEAVENAEKWFDENKNEVSINTEYGKMIGYEFIDKENKRDNFIIVVHGYGNSSKGMSYLAERLFKSHNLLLIDLMAHGKSEGHTISFGSLDSYNISKWCDYLNEKYDCNIIIYGISMGAATVMNSLDKGVSDIDNVKAIIEDCGYISLKDQFAYELDKLFNIPANPTLDIANLYFKYKGKYSIYDVDVRKNLENNKKPFLIIHGDSDTFVPYEHAKEAFKLLTKNGNEHVFFESFKDALHAQCMHKYENEYFEKINAFIDYSLNINN